MAPSLFFRHAGVWDFSEEFEMPELSRMAQQGVENAAGHVIGVENFAPFLESILRDIPNARKLCLNIVEKHADEIFGGSPKYESLCSVIQADSQFLFEFTARMVNRQKDKAQTAPSKRENTDEEDRETVKRQKFAGRGPTKEIEHAPTAGKETMDQVAALRPEDVQCCRQNPSRFNSEEPPSTQTSSARDLLKANGYVNFNCPDCREHFDAKIKLQDKFTHQCRNRHQGKGTQHTGAIWHAFFRSGVAMSLSAERQFWGSFERLQKTLDDDKLN